MIPCNERQEHVQRQAKPNIGKPKCTSLASSVGLTSKSECISTVMPPLSSRSGHVCLESADLLHRHLTLAGRVSIILILIIISTVMPISRLSAGW